MHHWLYNEERDAFIVEEAGWVDDEPQIEYRFSYFSGEEVNEIASLGGLDKWWLNEDGFVEGEFFAFGQYLDQAAFDVERTKDECWRLQVVRVVDP